jgi:hypothetical protein
MKYLRKFNESVTPKKLYTTEDIEDFFYSFIDDKYLKFEKTEETSDRHVSTIFKFTEKFNRIKSSESMQNYIQLLTEIEKKCRQWNLKFELNIGTFAPIFIIKQPIPVILPGIYDATGNYATTGIQIGSKTYRFKKFRTMNDNMEFFYTFELEPYGVGSAKNAGRYIGGEFLKKDYLEFATHTDEVIKRLKDEFPVPLEFIETKNNPLIWQVMRYECPTQFVYKVVID